jgi:hypothetical protein
VPKKIINRLLNGIAIAYTPPNQNYVEIKINGEILVTVHAVRYKQNFYVREKLAGVTRFVYVRGNGSSDVECMAFTLAPGVNLPAYIHDKLSSLSEFDILRRLASRKTTDILA